MPAGGPATAAQAGALNQNAAIVAAAAKKYGIPNWVLWGVYGMETSFGADVNTSSAGAVGSFQFLPSTARGYGYPVTNATDPTTFTAQADAAAHYLSDLYHQTGSWNTALEHYSGGGYGQSQVQAKGGTSGINPANIPGVGAAIQAVNSAGDVASSAASVVGFLTSPTNWLRIGEVIIGVLLILMGLRSLSGNSVSPSDLAAAAAMVK
jgi:Transglycosylase SLT domain